MGEDKETQDAVKAAVAEHERLVIGDEMQRQQNCMREVQEVLNKYSCSLVPRCMISPGNIEFMVETIVIPPEVLEKRQEKQDKMQASLYEEIAARGEKHAREAGPVSKKSKGQSGQEG